MRIKTIRFGEIEAADEQIITFPWGLPGFPKQKKYIAVEYQKEGPLFFLQSVDTPELTFIIADPFYFLGNKYAVDIPGPDLEALEISAPGEVAVYVIISIREQGKEISANLMAPLVINTTRQIGRQVILADSPYNSRFPLTKQAGPEAVQAQAE